MNRLLQVHVGAILMGAAALLVGCGEKRPPDEQLCIDVSRELTRTPGSFKTDEVLRGEGHVVVIADAANAYGTPVRTTFICNMDPDAGIPFIDSITIDGVEPHPLELVNAQAKILTVKRR